MKRNILLANRLREVFLNGHWIANTNFKEQLHSLDWQQATQSIGNLNSIAALTYHVNYYLDGLLAAFQSGRLEMSDTYSFDLPLIRSKTEWNNLVSGFLINAEKFADEVERMEDSSFDLPFVEAQYGTLLRNIEGVIEHSYYHLGQISLIKKMMEKNEA